jgi:hypothetical protein
MRPVGDGPPACNQPPPTVLRDRWQRDVIELGSDRVEQVADALTQDLRADRYSEGDKHDQQGVFGRRGALFIPVKTTDQPVHMLVLQKLEHDEGGDAAQDRALKGPAGASG